MPCILFNMKVSGFTFIRNARRFDYPIVEAIQSILPLCDEVVVAVGNSEDDTLEMIQAIQSTKIRIVHTVWDDTLRAGGQVLAMETNKALQALASDTDWAFYIQGDEVLHEQYIPVIRQAMEAYKDDANVDGLLLHYLHFYGAYDYIGSPLQWYPFEIRILKPFRDIYSYKDAQGFRKGNNEKLKVHKIPAWMYHYGWVKDPRAMQDKQQQFNKYWHDDAWVAQHVLPGELFDYGKVRYLQRFTGTHPAVMQNRIQARQWTFDYDISVNHLSIKERIKKFLLEKLGWDTGYKNYTLLR